MSGARLSRWSRRSAQITGRALVFPVVLRSALGAMLGITVALAATGCGGSGSSSGSPASVIPPPAPESPTEPPPVPGPTLSGPDTHITVVIPPGWHQVANGANKEIPEAVTPTTCGSANPVTGAPDPVTCALGLARIATFAAPTAAAAAQAMEQMVLKSDGVKASKTIYRGPGKVGGLDGYRDRFTLTNRYTTLTAEVAVRPSGTGIPDTQGNREYSMVFAWVPNLKNAPRVDVIDHIIDSVRGKTR